MWETMNAWKRIKLKLSAPIMYLLTLLDLSTVSEEPETEPVTKEPCNSENVYFFFPLIPVYITKKTYLAKECLHMSCPLETAMNTVNSKRYLKFYRQERQETIQSVDSFNQLTHISLRALIK